MSKDSSFKRILWGLSIASALCGCTMIPALDSPKPPVAESWPTTEQLTQTPQAAHIHWKSFFTDQDVQRVVETALANNRDARVAALRVQQMREQFRIQRAELLPNASLDVTGVRQRIAANLPFPGGPDSFIVEYYTGQVGGSWTIDLFGRIQSLTQSALEQYFATEEAQRAVQVSLIAEVVNVYLQLQADLEILRLTEDTLETQQQSFGLIQARFDKGIATQLDVAQAQMPVETARVNHALYTRLVEQDKHALQVLLGIPQIDHLISERQLDAVFIRDDLPAGLPSEVLLLRPDIRQAEHELRAANANIGAARGAFFPSINLTGGIGQSSLELSDLIGGNKIWSITPSVSLPIFQGGALIANLKATKAEREMAIASYEKAIQVAFREVADELVAKATLTEQLNAQIALMDASQRAYDVSYARYHQGIDNFLTVLDAQRMLFEAQQAAIETRKAQLVNLVNLYKVLGGGQQLAGEEAPAAVASSKASAPAVTETVIERETVVEEVVETPAPPAPIMEEPQASLHNGQMHHASATAVKAEIIRVDGVAEQQRVVYGSSF